MAGGSEAPRPTITMPGAARRLDHDNDHDHDQHDRTDQSSPAPAPASGGDKGDAKGGERKGWFGGILTKLSLRPSNQMILPDDSNPSIVWDAASKRWRNLDADGDEAAARPPPPPPKTTDLPHHAHQPHQPVMQHQPAMQHPPGAPSPPIAGPAAPSPPTSNIFKMQKSRHIKKSYVDVFNPGGAARALPPASEVLGPALAPAAGAPAYFVPPPATHEGAYSGGI